MTKGRARLSFSRCMLLLLLLLLLLFLLLLLLRSPPISLGFTILGEIFAYVTVF